MMIGVAHALTLVLERRVRECLPATVLTHILIGRCGDRRSRGREDGRRVPSQIRVRRSEDGTVLKGYGCGNTRSWHALAELCGAHIRPVAIRYVVEATRDIERR